MAVGRVPLLGYIRYGIGASMLFGVTPQYLAMWLVWRSVSLVLPDWVYQWGDDKLYSLYQRLVLFFFEHCTGVEVIMYGDTEELLKRKENVIYSANHQSTVDWMIANIVSVRGGNLGHLRYVMKDTLQLIPLYGWYFHVHGCIYVKRGKFNQHKMLKMLNYLENDKINTWLVIFPEGTCYTPSYPPSIESSEKFAKDSGKTPLKHHLFPKHRGTWLALKHLHRKLDAIYDVNVYYEGSRDPVSGKRLDSPQLLEFLMGICPRLHIKVRRIPMSEAPTTEEDLKQWLYELFQQKDLLMAPFFDGVLDHDACSLSENTIDANSRSSFSKLEEKSVLKETEVTQSYYDKIIQFYGGKKSVISIGETLPAFIVYFLMSVGCIYFPWARKAYFSLIIYGTLGAYGWLAVKSVC